LSSSIELGINWLSNTSARAPGQRPTLLACRWFAHRTTLLEGGGDRP